LASYINNNRHARPYLDDNGAITVRTPQSKLGMAMTVLAYYSRLASWAVHRFDALMAVNAQTRTVENQIQATGFDHPGFQRALRLTERSLSRLRAELPATVKLYAFSADHREPFATAMGALLTQQSRSLMVLPPGRKPPAAAASRYLQLTGGTGARPVIGSRPA